jgi:hypothetical protein
MYLTDRAVSSRPARIDSRQTIKVDLNPDFLSAEAVALIAFD